MGGAGRGPVWSARTCPRFQGRDMSRRPKRRRAAAVQRGSGEEGDQYSTINFQFSSEGAGGQADGEMLGFFRKKRLTDGGGLS